MCPLLPSGLCSVFPLFPLVYRGHSHCAHGTHQSRLVGASGIPIAPGEIYEHPPNETIQLYDHQDQGIYRLVIHESPRYILLAAPIITRQ